MLTLRVETLCTSHIKCSSGGCHAWLPVTLLDSRAENNSAPAFCRAA